MAYASVLQTSDPPEDGDVALLVTGGPQGFVDFLGQLLGGENMLKVASC